MNPKHCCLLILFLICLCFSLVITTRQFRLFVRKHTNQKRFLSIIRTRFKRNLNHFLLTYCIIHISWHVGVLYILWWSKHFYVPPNYSVLCYLELEDFLKKIPTAGGCVSFVSYICLYMSMCPQTICMCLE